MSVERLRWRWAVDAVIKGTLTYSVIAAATVLGGAARASAQTVLHSGYLTEHAGKWAHAALWDDGGFIDIWHDDSWTHPGYGSVVKMWYEYGNGEIWAAYWVRADPITDAWASNRYGMSVDFPYVRPCGGTGEIHMRPLEVWHVPRSPGDPGDHTYKRISRTTDGYLTITQNTTHVGTHWGPLDVTKVIQEYDNWDPAWPAQGFKTVGFLFSNSTAGASCTSLIEIDNFDYALLDDPAHPPVDTLDEDANGVPDFVQILAYPEIYDCNGNGLLDVADIAEGRSNDCNGNGIPDSCDIAEGTSEDIDGNGIPDECTVNLTTGTYYDTIQEAIDDSNTGEVILAPPTQYAAEPVLDFDGHGATLRSVDGSVAQPEGGHYTLADQATLMSDPGHDLTLGGLVTAPPNRDPWLVGGSVTTGASATLAVEIGAFLTVTAPSGATFNGTTDLAGNATLTCDADLTMGPGDPGAPVAFTRHVIDPSISDPSDLPVVDLDEDGYLDVLTTGWWESFLFWYRGDDSTPPGFTEHQAAPTVYANASNAHAADLNGDQHIDVLVCERFNNRIVWYEHDGVVAPGTPGFTKHTVASGVNYPIHTRTADVDGDGDMDVVSAAPGADVFSWHENQGETPTPTFITHTLAPSMNDARAIMPADINDDGHIDFVTCAVGADTVSWWEHDGAEPPAVPTFTHHAITTSADEASWVDPADIDGDGDIDVLTAVRAMDEVVLWLNDGQPTPSFTEQVVSADADYVAWVHSADIDGDGDLDIVAGLRNEVRTLWYENLGGSPPVFVEHTVFDEPSGPLAAMNPADVDGDGDVDVVASLKIGEVVWYENTYEPAVGATWTSLSTGALLSAGGALTSEHDVTLLGGTLAAGAGLGSSGSITGYGTLDADTTSSGSVTLQGDTYVHGDYTNDGTTTIQNGTLTVLGALTDNGTIVGDFFTPLRPEGPRAAGDGLFVEGGYHAGAGATLAMPSSDALIGVGGPWDVAIDASARFDLSLATLRMVGVGPEQTLELMSTDIGNDLTGLDRTLAGHYPLGRLRVGPTATTVRLVDAHDNDGQGQSACEALYVSNLVIDAGATLITGGCRVYYETLTLGGSVDDPSNLILLAPAPECDGDVTGDGRTDVFDFSDLAVAFGTSPGDPQWNAAADLVPDGTIDVFDFSLLAANFGCDVN